MQVFVSASYTTPLSTMKHLFKSEKQIELQFLGMLSLLLLLNSLMTDASSDRFQEMIELQRSHCLCAGMEQVEVEFPCCGQCSCDESCYDMGTCCLVMFTDFQHAQRTFEEQRYVFRLVTKA